MCLPLKVKAAESNGARTDEARFERATRAFWCARNRHLYDGEQPILEYKGNGTVAGMNVYGNGVDEILMRADYVADSGWARLPTYVPGATGWATIRDRLARPRGAATFLATYEAV